MREPSAVRGQRRAILAVAAAFLGAALAIRSAYYQLVLTEVMLWAVLSLAWNILSGYSGYFSFGHAAFWGLGAYTVTLGMVKFGLPRGSASRSAPSSGRLPAPASAFRPFASRATISHWRCSPIRCRCSTSSNG
jgi:ABC-type branched-subunit amino acid transport system permease subunit